MEEEGQAEDLTDPPYAETFANLNMRMLMDPEEQAKFASIFARVQEVLTRFYASKTSMELYEQGQSRRLLLGQVATPADIGDSKHLAAREWWLEFDQPTKLGSTTHICDSRDRRTGCRRRRRASAVRRHRSANITRKSGSRRSGFRPKT